MNTFPLGTYALILLFSIYPTAYGNNAHEETLQITVRKSGNGWLVRHFGSRIAGVSLIYERVTLHQGKIREQKTRLSRALQELSDAHAQQVIRDKFAFLSQQEEKLAEIIDRLEELTYTYILMHSAHQLLPELSNEEDMNELLSEINKELKSTEEIEQEIYRDTHEEK